MSGTTPEAAQLPGWAEQGSLDALPERQRRVVDGFLEEAAGLPEVTAVQVESIEGGPLLVTVWAERLAGEVLRVVDDAQLADHGAGVSFLALSNERAPAPDPAAPGVMWLARRIGGEA